MQDEKRVCRLESSWHNSPEVTSLESFDFTFNPDIDEEKIRDLSTLKFIDQNQIALFLGAPGVGTTHLALAIGLLAVRAGKRVYCTSAKRLGQEILLGKLRNNLDQLFKKILSSHLWIIDDWGVVSMNREIAEQVFDLMDRRKHSSAMLLTGNRDVSEWAEVFPDPLIANATVYRIFDRAYAEAKRKNPARWPSKIRNWNRITEVRLNPRKESETTSSGVLSIQAA